LEEKTGGVGVTTRYPPFETLFRKPPKANKHNGKMQKKVAFLLPRKGGMRWIHVIASTEGVAKEGGKLLRGDIQESL